ADIADLKIGPVRHVVSINSLPLFQLAAGMHDHWMFERPTNVLYEQAPHPLSQICALIGEVDDLSVTYGQSQLLRGGHVFHPDWQFSIRGKGATAQMSLSFANSFPDARLHIVGQDGTIHIDQLKNLYTIDRRTQFAAPVDTFKRSLHHGVTASGSAM